MSMQQDDHHERAAILQRDGFLIGIAGLSLLNGMHFSPLFDLAAVYLGSFLTGLFISSPLLLFYFTSLLLSAATLLLAGVPAALFECFTGRKETDTASLAIWLAATALLALPSLGGLTVR
jgi:hypothetical protein